MKKKLVTSLLLCGLFATIGCKKEKTEDSFDRSIHNLYGEYMLSDIHWPGLPVNLNNDNTANWELLYEFKDIIGYYEPDYTANVGRGMVFDDGKPWAKSSTAFNAIIPCPHFILSNGKWTCIGIRSINVTLRATEDNFCLGTNSCLLSPGYNNQEDVFLASIQDISLVVKSYDDSIFQVAVHCSLPYDEPDKEQKLNENYLYYSFSK